MRKRFIFQILLIIIYTTLASSVAAQVSLPSDTLSVKSDSLLLHSVQSLDSLDASYEAHKSKFEITTVKVTDQVVTTVFKKDRDLLADSIIKTFDDLPSFGIYKDNYIVIGGDLLKHPDSENSDAKFQISVVQRLTNSVLPFRTYLFLTYTQLAFWDVFKESFPFRDINFNPTIGLGKPLVYQNRYLGDISVQFEHESNGRDGDDSRSWNKVSFSGLFLINRHWNFFSKLWIPIVDGENNPDLVQYKGYGTFALSYNQKNKYNVGVVLTPRSGGFGNMNITLNASYRLFKNENQYLFFELYNGYGEGLLDYKEFHQRFRLGFVIRPSFRFIY